MEPEPAMFYGASVEFNTTLFGPDFRILPFFVKASVDHGLDQAARLWSDKKGDLSQVALVTVWTYGPKTGSHEQLKKRKQRKLKGEKKDISVV